MSERKSPARRRILDSATYLFSTRGVRAVSMDQIIDRADVAKATMYSHFRTKDDLIRAYLDERLDGIGLDLVHIASRNSSGPSTIADMFENLAQSVDKGQFTGCPFINVMSAHPDEQAEPGIWSIVHRQRDLLLNFVDANVAPGHGHDDTVSAILAMFGGARIDAASGDSGQIRAAGRIAERLAQVA